MNLKNGKKKPLIDVFLYLNLFVSIATSIFKFSSKKAKTLHPRVHTVCTVCTCVCTYVNIVKYSQEYLLKEGDVKAPNLGEQIQSEGHIYISTRSHTCASPQYSSWDQQGPCLQYNKRIFS